MTTTLDQSRTEPHTLTSGIRVLLIGAPLLMALARLLLVPFDDQDWDKTMTDMAAHAGRSNAGWFLAMVASGLLAVTGVVLAQRLQMIGRARSAMVSMLTIAVGWAGCAASNPAFRGAACRSRARCCGFPIPAWSY